MNDEGKLLRERATYDERSAINLQLCRAGRQLGLDQCPKADPSSAAGGDKVLGAGKCMQPANQGILRTHKVATVRERVRHDRLDDGQQIFRPVLQLVNEYGLPCLGLLALSDVSGDRMNANRFSGTIE